MLCEITVTDIALFFSHTTLTQSALLPPSSPSTKTVVE
jgi:hypothetical protein